MATTLPTVTVNDTQLNLLMETFDGQYGGPGQPATVSEAYRQWLIQMLKSRVYTSQFYTDRVDQITQQHNDALQTALNNLRAELDNMITG